MTLPFVLFASFVVKWIVRRAEIRWPDRFTTKDAKSTKHGIQRSLPSHDRRTEERRGTRALFV